MDRLKSTEMKERTPRGIAALVVSRDRKILVVQETIGKPQLDRRIGDWTIPTETVEEGETSSETVIRLVKEEIGDRGDIEFDLGKEWLGDYCILGSWGRVFILHFKGTSDNQRTFSAERDEVINHRWINPEEIKSMPRRGGLLEIIEDYIAGKRGVVRETVSLAHKLNE